MIEFEVSAPGKITLIGEHAQLLKENKATVLAGSVDLRTTLKFTELPDSQNVIKIEFPRENLSVDIPLQKVLNYFGGNDEFNSYRWYKKANLTNSFVLSELEIPLLEKLKVMNLKVVLYLLISIAQREQIDIKSFHVHVNSELPAMSGESLGNMMSSTVCLAACFLHWSRLQKNIHDTEFDTDHLEKISKYATECEDFIYTHDIMPGLDANVCTYGSIIEFYPERPVNVFNIPSMKILLVDTNKVDTITTEMKNIYNLKKDYTTVADSIATSVKAVTELACLELRNFSSDQTNESEYTKSVLNLHKNLGFFMIVNQGLICTLDLLDRNLDTLSFVATQYSMPWKYTNGDCGRYAYILLPPNTEDQVIKDVSEKISKLSYIVTMVNLGCEGVRIE